MGCLVQSCFNSSGAPCPQGGVGQPGHAFCTVFKPVGSKTEKLCPAIREWACLPGVDFEAFGDDGAAAAAAAAEALQAAGAPERAVAAAGAARSVGTALNACFEEVTPDPVQSTCAMGLLLCQSVRLALWL